MRKKTVIRRKTMTTPQLRTGHDVYTPRILEFTQAGRDSGLTRVKRDQRRVAMVIVDPNLDFTHSTGSLYVPGSEDDVDRLTALIRREADQIDTMMVSLDTHPFFHINHENWWIGKDGRHPDPFTVINYADIVSGKWRPVFEDAWSKKYVKTLEDQRKKNHRIWPYHCQIGTPGWSITPSLEETLAWYAAGRCTEPIRIMKGMSSRTEYYGIFAPEVPDPEDPNAMGVNAIMLKQVARHDLIYVAGWASSHCVLETMRQVLTFFGNDKAMVSKLRFLMDCTSSVQAPDFDFEAMVQAELKVMEQLGVKLVLSTDPIK
jgi:nicotinamidase/pyrazinamidase